MRPIAHWLFRAFLPIVITIGLCGCSPDGRRSELNPLDRPPIDSLRVQSPDLIASWKYREESSADLDGNGRREKIMLAADAELGGGNIPLWEDGHRWGLLVESDRGERTLLYGAFVPNGRASAAVLQPDSDGRRKVLIEERRASELRVFEVEYRGPGKVRLSSAWYSQVEGWLTLARR